MGPIANWGWERGERIGGEAQKRGACMVGWLEMDR